MLKEIIKTIDSAIPSLFPVDPVKFNDPVAMQTEWKAVRSARLSRASSKLIQDSPDRLVYKPSLTGRIMGIVFFLMGGFVVVLYFLVRQGGGGITVTSGSGDPFFLALVGLALMAVGILAFFLAMAPVVFDKKVQLFYMGRKQNRQPDATNARLTVRFGDIHAIQLLTRLEKSQSNNGNNMPARMPDRYYRVYDLNLVKHDGQRMFVTTYGNAGKAREDAAKIGAFVHAPVWDGIDG